LCVRGRDAVDAPGRCRVASGNGAAELSQDDEAKVLEVLRAAVASQTARGFVLYAVDPLFSYDGPGTGTLGTDSGMDMGTD